jgi:hypothetical protein
MEEVGQETLRFDNLSFYVEERTFLQKIKREPATRKCILENISGAFQSGEIIAFMVRTVRCSFLFSQQLRFHFFSLTLRVPPAVARRR